MHLLTTATAFITTTFTCETSVPFMSEDTPLQSSLFEPFDLPLGNQRLLNTPHPYDAVIPLALRLSPHSIAKTSLDVILENIQTLQQEDNTLTKKLSRHGALLFRGLPLFNAEDFSKFAHAFGYKPHEVIGSIANRPLLAPNVSLANEAPKEVLIYNHNELPRVPHSPGYIFFYCYKAAKKGGQHSISSSLELFHRVKQEIPEFINELAKKGILSTVTYKFDKQFEGGTTLRQAFGKDIEDDDDEATRRTKIEAQIARYGRGKSTTWEWIDDGLVVKHRIPVIRTQPGTKIPTLFTGLAAYYKAAQDSTDARRNVSQLFGDGTPIPEKYLAHLARITDEIRLLHKWQEGDVLIFDNVIAQHGREPWEGEQSDRIVLASLFDGDTVAGAYGPEDWAQIVHIIDE